jgi:diadenosine tetraphosphate (Ap4A) HIT family hydrolase
MAIIYETKNFILESHEHPFVSREEGGHLRLKIKDVSVSDRTQLDLEIAYEYMYLSMIAGESLEKAMNKCGVNVVKVNYQDMGNWAFKKNKTPYLHMHIIGRAKDAKVQVFPESVQLPDRSTGFYDLFKPLNEEDIKEIKKQMEFLLQEEKYQNNKWKLN